MTNDTPRMKGRSPRSLEIAKRGIKTDIDFANLMAALACDVIQGKVTPSTVNAICKASAKPLKVLELQYKIGDLERRLNR